MYFLDFLKEYRFFCVILIEFLYSSPPQRKKIFKKIWQQRNVDIQFSIYTLLQFIVFAVLLQLMMEVFFSCFRMVTPLCHLKNAIK